MSSIKWNKLNSQEKAWLWLELRNTFSELERVNPDEVAQAKWSLIEEAYAAGYDCLVAGWPSSKGSSGKCLSPEKQNPSYAHYLGCPSGELLCNPNLFGDGLCVRFSSSQEKNSAFAQCEQKFSQEGRLFSQVLEEVDESEMNDLLLTTQQKCQHTANSYICQKLRKKLQFFLPFEEPLTLTEAQRSLAGSDPEKMLKGAKKLQSEMEADVSEFKRVCQGSTEVTNKIYCKNLALRVQKSRQLLPKLYTKLDLLTANPDCINCSGSKMTAVLNQDSLPSLEATEQNTCSAEEKKIIASRCDEEVMCTIASTVFTSAITIAELLGQKPKSCLSSQNSCITNIISALVDSILSLVTGIWDILGKVVDWTGEKLGEFWDYVTGVEDKTADAQHLINNMSEKDLNEVKTNPIQWVSNLAGNIWKGLKQWIKEDIFCEKWSGVPRASQCLKPSRGFDCMSCRTMIAGTCSAGGVVLAEVVPALITGGTANLVARAATGAKEFANFIKVSKSYQKVASAVDKLSDVRALKVLTQGTKASVKVMKTAVSPVVSATRISSKALATGYKAMVNSAAFKALSKSMDVAARYTGLKALNTLNSKMYAKGYEFVDSVFELKRAYTHSKVTNRISKSSQLVAEKEQELKPLYEELTKAYSKGDELQQLRYQMMDLKKIETPSAEDIKKMGEIEARYTAIQQEMILINDNYLNKMHEIYQKEGIPSLLVKGDDGAQTLVMDFSSPPTKRSAFEFYRKVKNRFGMDKVTLSLKENAELGFAGFFHDAAKRIEMGPSQGFSLLDDYFNSVSKHESRHSMFFAKRSKGDDSMFHVRFFASRDGNLLNADKIYDTFMSAEELYTYSTDLQSLAQVFKGDFVANLAKREGMLDQIAGHNNIFKKIIHAHKDVSQQMLDSLDELMKSSSRQQGIHLSATKDGNWTLHVRDRLKREAEITLVGAEEKLLANELMELNKKLEAQVNLGVEKKLKEMGVDTDALAVKIQKNELTAEEAATLTKVSQDFMTTPEAAAMMKQLDTAVEPLLKNARETMSQINELAKVQLKESDKMEELLKIYRDKEKGGQNLQLEELREQMFKTAKNVKEDYKGFALNK